MPHAHALNPATSCRRLRSEVTDQIFERLDKFDRALETAMQASSQRMSLMETSMRRLESLLKKSTQSQAGSGAQGAPQTPLQSPPHSPPQSPPQSPGPTGAGRGQSRMQQMVCIPSPYAPHSLQGTPCSPSTMCAPLPCAWPHLMQVLLLRRGVVRPQGKCGHPTVGGAPTPPVQLFDRLPKQGLVVSTTSTPR